MNKKAKLLAGFTVMIKKHSSCASTHFKELHEIIPGAEEFLSFSFYV